VYPYVPYMINPSDYGQFRQGTRAPCVILWITMIHDAPTPRGT